MPQTFNKTTFISAGTAVSVNFLCGFLILLAVYSAAAVFHTHYAYAQNLQEISKKYVQAQQFEMQGEYEKALALYKEINLLQPDNPMYFLKIRQMLENLKQYDEWLKYIDSGLKRNPRDYTLLSERARALYFLGREAEAKKSLEAIIELDPESEVVYRMVMQAQQILHDYDGAIATLLLGRKNLKNPRLFANELGNLYQICQNYKMAAVEYLTLAASDPMYFSIAEQMIFNFPSDSIVAAEVTDALEAFVADSSQNVNYRSLLARFYVRINKFREAFNNYILLDSLARTQGGYVLSFADQMYSTKAYDYAILAYRYCIERFPKSAIIGNADFGLARSYEAASLDTRNENSGEFLALAVSQYTAISRKYPNTSWEMEAYYRIGEIKLRRQFDLDGAITAYETVRTRSPNVQTLWEAVIALGDCYRAQGNLDKAAEYYTKLETAQNQFNPLKQKAQFKLIQNLYYIGDFATTRRELDNLFAQTPPSSDLSNDILALALFIDENTASENTSPSTRGGKDIESLKRYARAELLIEQHKSGEAEAILVEITRTSPNHPAADNALFAAAELQKEMGRYNESAKTFTELQQKYPSSPLVERAVIAAAGLYEEYLQQPDAALAEYEKFLLQFPNSIYIDKVRTRIRSLKQIK